MHEFSLCQNLLEQVLATARQHRAVGVKSIDVRLWPVSGISARQLAAAFRTASSGTPAAGAELRVEESQQEYRCRQCHHRYADESGRMACPACGGSAGEPLIADTLLITNIELLSEKRP